VILGAITVMLGVIYADAIGFSAVFVWTAGICAAVSLGTLLILCIALEAYHTYRYLSHLYEKEDDDDEAFPEKDGSSVESILGGVHRTLCRYLSFLTGHDDDDENAENDVDSL